jgi:hypothetical protein
MSVFMFKAAEKQHVLNSKPRLEAISLFHRSHRSQPEIKCELL